MTSSVHVSFSHVIDSMAFVARRGGGGGGGGGALPAAAAAALARSQALATMLLPRDVLVVAAAPVQRATAARALATAAAAKPAPATKKAPAPAPAAGAPAGASGAVGFGSNTAGALGHPVRRTPHAARQCWRHPSALRRIPGRVDLARAAAVGTDPPHGRAGREEGHAADVGRLGRPDADHRAAGTWAAAAWRALRPYAVG